MSIYSSIENLARQVEYQRTGADEVQVRVMLSQPSLHRGEILMGTVHLIGGREPRPILKCTVELQAFYLVHTKHGAHLSFRTDSQILLEEAIPQLLLGETREYDFEFTLKEESAITSLNPVQGYGVMAQAHLSWAVDARHRTHLIVLPQRPYWALEEILCRHYGFESIGRQALGSGISFNLRAPERWKGFIDAIAFNCQRIPGGIQVLAKVNWQEHSLTDYLKAMVAADRTQHELTLSEYDLIDESGTPSERVRSYLDTFFSQLGLPLM